VSDVWMTLTPSELSNCWDVAVQRSIWIMRENRQQPTYGSSRLWRERIAKDVLSCPTEYAVAKWTGQYWHGAEPYDPDAPDVGQDIEVRATHHETGRLLVHDADHDDRRFYLVIPHPTNPFRYRIVGWLWGVEAKQRQWWRTDVREPCYLAPQPSLHDAVRLFTHAG